MAGYGADPFPVAKGFVDVVGDLAEKEAQVLLRHPALRRLKVSVLQNGSPVEFGLMSVGHSFFPSQIPTYDKALVSTISPEQLQQHQLESVEDATQRYNAQAKVAASRQIGSGEFVKVEGVRDP